MFNVTDTMRKDILKAVRGLEKSTRGEFVCVVTKSSARYVHYPVIWAAFGALLLPLLNPVFASFGRPPVVTFELQAVAFVMLALVLLYTPLRVIVTPKAVREANCSRIAFEQFFIRRLNETENRTGVLLFVSVEEQYVELIADDGINGKVKDGEWNDIVAGFTGYLKKGLVHEGFLTAIAACEAILTRHFPGKRGNKNELPDDLIELPPANLIS
jgi:putative membrane protein